MATHECNTQSYRRGKNIEIMTDDFPNLEANVRFQSKEVHEMGRRIIINKTLCYKQIVCLLMKQRIKGKFWKQSELEHMPRLTVGMTTH